jgi:hypothetical protein
MARSQGYSSKLCKLLVSCDFTSPRRSGYPARAALRLSEEGLNAGRIECDELKMFCYNTASENMHY